MRIDEHGDVVLLSVGDQERRAIRGGLAWVVAGPFSRKYDLWSSRPGWSREAADEIAERFREGAVTADGAIALTAAEAELLTAALEAALGSFRPLPSNDWEILARASRETAERVARELRAYFTAA